MAASDPIIRSILDAVEEALHNSDIPTFDEMEVRSRLSELEEQSEEIRQALTNDSIRELPDKLDRIASEIDSIGSSLYSEFNF